MSIRLQAPLSLNLTGQVANLRAQLVAFAAPSTWTDSGSPISAGFGDQGGGNYLWEGSAPDGFDGGVRFYNASTGVIYGADFASKYRYVGPSLIDLTQPVPRTNTAETVGDALNAARAQGFGKWAISVDGLTLNIFASDGSTIVHSFVLDSATNPTSRT